MHDVLGGRFRGCMPAVTPIAVEKLEGRQWSGNRGWLVQQSQHHARCAWADISKVASCMLDPDSQGSRRFHGLHSLLPQIHERHAWMELKMISDPDFHDQYNRPSSSSSSAFSSASSPDSQDSKTLLHSLSLSRLGASSVGHGGNYSGELKTPPLPLVMVAANSEPWTVESLSWAPFHFLEKEDDE
uniref:Uncharacterized protein n=1 Tax=Nelumbo nucifera TaxID=4432 RepID=A0A822XXH1_NELNU|nr:TPA_asm: hypothetical protein HUJ06_025344 [Nelumbo nucifera]